MSIKSQILNLNYNVLLDEYSKTETSAEDGVEKTTEHNEDVDQISKPNLL